MVALVAETTCSLGKMKARTSVALAREGRQRLEFHETKLIVSLIIHHLLTQIVVLLITTFCAISWVFQNWVTNRYIHTNIPHDVGRRHDQCGGSLRLTPIMVHSGLVSMIVTDSNNRINECCLHHLAHKLT